LFTLADYEIVVEFLDITCQSPRPDAIQSRYDAGTAARNGAGALFAELQRLVC
jgi:hypothetical protein